MAMSHSTTIRWSPARAARLPPTRGRGPDSRPHAAARRPQGAQRTDPRLTAGDAVFTVLSAAAICLALIVGTLLYSGVLAL